MKDPSMLARRTGVVQNISKTYSGFKGGRSPAVFLDDLAES
jgi:hypothetical protein